MHFLIMRTNTSFFIAPLIAVALTAVATAQDDCCFEPSYRLQCETVMQPQNGPKVSIGLRNRDGTAAGD